MAKEFPQDSEMQNLILKRRVVLQEAINTLNYQIANLQVYFSRLQVREWKRNRRKLKAELKRLPTPQQLKRSGSLIKKILTEHSLHHLIESKNEKVNSLHS